MTKKIPTSTESTSRTLPHVLGEERFHYTFSLGWGASKQYEASTKNSKKPTAVKDAPSQG